MEPCGCVVFMGVESMSDEERMGIETSYFLSDDCNGNGSPYSPFSLLS